MSNQYQFDFASPTPNKNAVLIGADLPDLPKVTRYYDEYTNETYSIKNSDVEVDWRIHFQGKTVHLAFGYLPQETQLVLKSWANWLLGIRAPKTATDHVSCFLRQPKEIQIKFFQLAFEADQIHQYWMKSFLCSGLDQHVIGAAKSILIFFSVFGVQSWTPDHVELLRSLSLGTVNDKYRAVRTGEVFLSFFEETKIIEHLDEVSLQIKNGSFHDADETLVADCLLYWIYAHGVRPIQIARTDLNDLRIREQADNTSTVHLRIKYAKQSRHNKKQVDTRTMKRDWTPIMAEWLRRRTSGRLLFQPDRKLSLFGYSPQKVSRSIIESTNRITGVSRSATDLRHTAAQRMVDSGTSALELAEFMMHADIETGQVYYDSSPTQADKINKALGLSPIYSELAVITKTKVIDKKKLLDLPPDNQVGAAPHGFPVIGIGGCSFGQSLCTKNPALSCYTCDKFMPLNDPQIHSETRDTLKGIVDEFVSSSKDDPNNPAFMQLRRTIETIDALGDILGESQND